MHGNLGYSVRPAVFLSSVFAHYVFFLAGWMFALHREILGDLTRWAGLRFLFGLLLATFVVIPLGNNHMRADTAAELWFGSGPSKIPMTSPVDMSYEATGSDRMTGMAFLYRTPELGPVGTDGVVRIEDVAPRAYASTGVRGSYSEAHHREGLERVEKWIATQSTWQADGPSRYLGYNSPFVPWFWRYGEVQVPLGPVVPASTPEP